MNSNYYNFIAFSDFSTVILCSFHLKKCKVDFELQGTYNYVENYFVISFVFKFIHYNLKEISCNYKFHTQIHIFMFSLCHDL